MHLEKLTKKINDFDIISFDIFDTLIKRDLPNPHDLYDIVYSNFLNYSHIIHNSNFRKERIYAENQARMHENKIEVNLKDIYNYIKGYSNEDKIKLMHIEEKLEINICVPNLDIISIFNKAVKSSKIVIITSDMYLPVNIIHKILMKNNIKGYDKLFLSNSLNMTKNNGSLWKFLKKIYKSSKILHIGDNFKSDFINPKKVGISSFKVNKDYYKLSYSNNKNNKYLNCFLNNHIKLDDNYFYKFGFECFGPFLFSYIKWLHYNLKNDNAKNVYFLSRDGYLMKKAYDLMYYNENFINTKYIYASRRGYIIPSLYKYKNITSMLQNMFNQKIISIKEIVYKLGLKLHDINKNDLHSVDVNFKYKNIHDLLNDSNNEIFLKNIYKLVVNNSIKERNLISDYFCNEIESEKISIVDIGWFGNMQNAMNEILDYNVSINGYYVGVSSNSPHYNKLNMKGYLFDKDNGIEYELFLKTFTEMFELFFTNNGEGSFIKFDKNLKPIKKEFEYNNKDSKNYINNFQKGALNFIKEFNNSLISKYLIIDKKESFSRMKTFASHPRKIDINNFRMIHRNNNKYLDFINPSNPFFYLMNYKKFVHDLSRSWMEGFMYQMLKIKLPYYYIYKIIRKIYNEKN